MSEQFSKTQLRLGLVPKGGGSETDADKPPDEPAPAQNNDTLGPDEEDILFRQPRRQNLIARLLGLFSNE